MLPEQNAEQIRSLYLDLIKNSLTDLIYRHVEKLPVQPSKLLERKAVEYLRSRGLNVFNDGSFDEKKRLDGSEWLPSAHTMIGMERLNNIQNCIDQVLKDNVPGDLIETGVWRGGATIFMRAMLKAYGVTDRGVWVADSFAGLPPPNAGKYPADSGDTLYEFRELAVSIDQVKQNFERYGLLDDQVHFLKGWFRDTLPNAPIRQLAVLRMDGDMYESTMDALVNLYPKLSSGGFAIIDDYGAMPSCKQAVHDYRDQNGITEKLIPIDWTGVFWRRD